MDPLQRRLRDHRPAPPRELVDEVVSRIEVARPMSHSRLTLRRLALAGVAAAVMLTVLAAFGGVGFAASGVSGAATSTVQAVSTFVKADQSARSTPTRGNSTNSGWNHNGNGNGDDECEDDNGNGAAEEEYCKPRLTICHFGQQTLTLPILAALAHLIFHYPNDYLGPCRPR